MGSQRPEELLETHAEFERLVEREANRSRRRSLRFGILMIHAEGAADRVASVLSKSLRSYDHAARAEVDGEFQALICDVSRESLGAAAERLASRLRDEGNRIRMGGAVFPEDAVATPDLLQRAAKALRRAMEEGSDRLLFSATAPASAERSDRLELNQSGRTVVGMISRLLNEGGDVESMLRRSIDLMAKAVDAERGLIFLLQDGTRLRAVLNMPDRPVELDADDYSTSVLRRAVTTAQAVRIADVEKDTWASGLSSVHQLGVTSILAVPVVSGSKVLGAVYLDSRNREKRFSDEDEAMSATFARLIARPIEQGAELKQRSEEVSKLQDVVRSGLSELGNRYLFGSIVGRSDGMRRIFETIERVAPSPYPVILVGETGTGKELVAKAIHFNSPRKAKPFLPVNCGAVTETLLESQLFGHIKGAYTGADQTRPGLFEAAGGGTLLLDEIEEMSDSMQKKLLRVLEESQVWRVGSNEPVKVDVRIVAATNLEIRDLVDEGRLRQDLYYRLNTFLLRMPPLRERAEDIPLLVDHFLEEIAKETKSGRLQMSSDAAALFMRYPWPGNVRELRNELRKLSVLARGEVRVEDLPAHIRETTGSIGRDLSLRDRLGEVDRHLILEALDRNDWNISRAAEDLGVNRNTLKTRMRKHGIKKTDIRNQRTDD